MSDFEKKGLDPEQEVEDDGTTEESLTDPKNTMLPNFGALLRQAVERDDDGPELKQGRDGKQTMAPTDQTYAEVTLQAALLMNKAKEKKKEGDEDEDNGDDKKKEAIRIPLSELRDRLNEKKDKE